MVDEIAKCTSVDEFQLTFVLLLRFLGTIVLRHDPVNLWQVKEDNKLEVVARLLHLHSL